MRSRSDIVSSDEGGTSKIVEESSDSKNVDNQSSKATMVQKDVDPITHKENPQPLLENNATNEGMEGTYITADQAALTRESEHSQSILDGGIDSRGETSEIINSRTPTKAVGFGSGGVVASGTVDGSNVAYYHSAGNKLSTHQRPRPRQRRANRRRARRIRR